MEKRKPTNSVIQSRPPMVPLALRTLHRISSIIIRKTQQEFNKKREGEGGEEKEVGEDEEEEEEEEKRASWSRASISFPPPPNHMRFIHNIELCILYNICNTEGCAVSLGRAAATTSSPSKA